LPEPDFDGPALADAVLAGAFLVSDCFLVSDWFLVWGVALPLAEAPFAEPFTGAEPLVAVSAAFLPAELRAGFLAVPDPAAPSFFAAAPSFFTEPGLVVLLAVFLVGAVTVLRPELAATALRMPADAASRSADAALVTSGCELGGVAEFPAVLGDKEFLSDMSCHG
jgi:hypothetical protein